MTNVRRPPVDLGSDVEVAENEVAERRVDVDPREDPGLALAELAEAVGSWDGEAIDPEGERVVALDDEDYR